MANNTIFVKDAYGIIHDYVLSVWIKKWKPLNTDLVSRQAEGPYKSVFELEGLLPIKLYQQYRRTHIKSVAILSLAFVMSLLFSSFGILHFEEGFLNAMAAVCAFIIVDAALFLNSYEHFVQRTNFLQSIRAQSPSCLFIAAALCVLIILLQLFVERVLGGWHELVRQYGTYYLYVRDNNELWRFIVGPFIHTGVSHWMINCILLLMFLPLVSKLSSLKSGFFVFVFGCVLSHLATYIAWLNQLSSTDAIVGVSGGVFAVMSLGCIATLLSGKVSKSIGFSLLLFVILCFSTPLFLKGNISHIAHAIGIFTGLFIGLISNVNWFRTR